MAKPISTDLDFQNVSQIVNYPGGFPPPPPNSKYTATFGNAVQTNYPIAHNLGSLDVLVQVYRIEGTSRNQVVCDVFLVDADNASISFSAPPGPMRVVILK